MGLKDNAKALIDANVYANGQEQITGQGLNATLKGIVDILPTTEEIVSGIKGVATTSTVPSATGFERWLVHEAGTYTNFGGIVVTAADLDIVNGVANNRVVLEVSEGVATKIVERVKGEEGVVNYNTGILSPTSTDKAETGRTISDFVGSKLYEDKVYFEPNIADTFATVHSLNSMIIFLRPMPAEYKTKDIKLNIATAGDIGLVEVSIVGTVATRIKSAKVTVVAGVNTISSFNISVGNYLAIEWNFTTYLGRLGKTLATSAYSVYTLNAFTTTADLTGVVAKTDYKYGVQITVESEKSLQSIEASTITSKSAIGEAFIIGDETPSDCIEDANRWTSGGNIILKEPISGENGDIVIWATTAGFIKLSFYSVVGNLATHKTTRITELKLGLNIITDYKGEEGDYLGWLYNSTTFPGRIGQLIASPNYSILMNAGEINTNTPVTTYSDRRYGIMTTSKSGLTFTKEQVDKIVSNKIGDSIGATYKIDTATTGKLRLDHVHIRKLNNGNYISIMQKQATIADYDAGTVRIYEASDLSKRWLMKLDKPWYTAEWADTKAEGNPMIWQKPDGSFLVFYNVARQSLGTMRALMVCDLNADATVFSNDRQISGWDNTTVGGTNIIEKNGVLYLPTYPPAGGMIYKSTDYGLTWVSVGSLITDTNGHDVHEPSVHFDINERMIFSYRNSSGYRRARASTDLGITWGDSFNLFYAPRSMSAVYRTNFLAENYKPIWIAVHNYARYDLPEHEAARRNMVLSVSNDGIKFKEIGYILKWNGINHAFEPSIEEIEDKILVGWSTFDSTYSPHVTSVPISEIFNGINTKFGINDSKF